MDFIHTVTGQELSFAQLRGLHPTTMFPSDFAGDFEDYAPIQPTPAPTHDPATHKAVKLPAAQDGGQWAQAWSVVALTAEEITAAHKATVPPKVTRRQARQALLLAGLLGNVQPAIDAIEDTTLRQLAQIEWDDSQEFERHRPLLIQLAGALGLDGEALDGLFIQAAGL